MTEYAMMYREMIDALELTGRYMVLKQCACVEHEGEKWLPLESFNKNLGAMHTTNAGYQSYCRECKRVANAANRSSEQTGGGAGDDELTEQQLRAMYRHLRGLFGDDE